MGEPVYCSECAREIWHRVDRDRGVCVACWNRGRRGPDVRLPVAERPAYRVMGFGGLEDREGTGR